MTGWVEENDLQTKVKAIRRLLAKEDMVKISIYHKKGQSLDKDVGAALFPIMAAARGRGAHPPAHFFARQRQKLVLDKVLAELGDEVNVESDVKAAGTVRSRYVGGRLFVPWWR